MYFLALKKIFLLRILDFAVHTYFLLHVFRDLNVKDDKKETITVVFHAILSDKFKLDDVTKIVIRGEDPVFEGWNKGGVVLEKERQVHYADTFNKTTERINTY